MTKQDETATEAHFTPPYTSFKTVMNLVNRMADEGAVPSRVDRSYLSNLPGSSQTFLMNGMKSLGMLDSQGRPTDYLTDMVNQPEMRKRLISDLVEDHYKGPLKLGKNATQQQLEEAFREYGISGSTLRKAIAFFLAAAKFAELELSPHFRTPKAPQRSGARQSRRKTAQRRDTGFPGSPPQTDFQESPRPSSGFHPFIQGLLDTLPDVGAEWPQAERQAWIKAAEATFAVLYEDEPKVSVPDTKGGGEEP